MSQLIHLRDNLVAYLAGAGTHTVAYGIDCPTGSWTGANSSNATWTVMLAAQ